MGSDWEVIITPDPLKNRLILPPFLGCAVSPTWCQKISQMYLPIVENLPIVGFSEVPHKTLTWKEASRWGAHS